MEQRDKALANAKNAFGQSAALNESADSMGSTSEVDAAMADFID